MANSLDATNVTIVHPTGKVNHMKKTASTITASMAIVAGIITAAPTALAAPTGTPGAVMTPAEMSAQDCVKRGVGESIGYADCGGIQPFKVRVWCTWAGQGLSETWRVTSNWAQCDRGVVRDQYNAIEIIFQ